MKIDAIPAWMCLIAAVILGYLSWFLTAGMFAIAALILYTRYDIKREIRRVMKVENEVRQDLVQERAKVKDTLDKRQGNS